jgi:Fe(II)/alpha-ketoglutarate-dependent arginine beta-hydroxylase
MYRLKLTSHENAMIAALLDNVAADYATVEDPELVSFARVLSYRLPERLLAFLEAFRLREPAAVCCVSGLEVDQKRIGPTPAHWRDSHLDSPSIAQEIFFLLCAAVLGDVFGWATQQRGRIMHDVLPIQGHEYQEIGSNSLQHLSWHTEDAFHPCRGDYVALMCLRNPDQVATTVCAITDLDWRKIDKEVLFRPEFTVMPDNSHQPAFDRAPSADEPETARLMARSFALIKSWTEQPEERPILFGGADDPYFALDPYHMDAGSWSAPAQKAFRQLCDEIEANLSTVILRPGDCVFLDNFRTVHGRESFRPRYDGTDRWLKRLNITRNLRGSRAWRLTADHRIIY